MRLDDAVKWFDQVESEGYSVIAEKPIGGSALERYSRKYDVCKVASWTTHAESALNAVFPVNHSVMRAWRTHAIRNADMWSSYETFESSFGVFQAACNQVRSGRIAGLADAIRAETWNELTQQAETLVAGGYLPAGAVIAGGALESFLRHLTAKHGITVPGEGSISAFNNAVGKARNQGSEVYNANDGKLVEAWGGIRNEAAHKPGEFKRSDTEVRMMIEGIREFLARHT